MSDFYLVACHAPASPCRRIPEGPALSKTPRDPELLTWNFSKMMESIPVGRLVGKQSAQTLQELQNAFVHARPNDSASSEEVELQPLLSALDDAFAALPEGHPLRPKLEDAANFIRAHATCARSIRVDEFK
jgi:hypothetical protein